MSIEQDLDDLKTMSQGQLDVIVGTLALPRPVRQKAAEILDAIDQDNFRRAIGDFDAATDTFVGLTKEFVALTEALKAESRSDLLGDVSTVVDRTGTTLAAVAEVPLDPAADQGQDGEDDPAPAAAAPPGSASPGSPSPGASPPAAPPAGTAMNSRKYAELAEEYVAIFDAATILADKRKTVDRVRSLLVGYRDRYEAVGNPLGVPWHVVGLIHAMESGFNFGRHLHNGDPLTARTVRVPAGRPKTGTPPFTWTESATDALRRKDLQDVGSWPLARQLYELERYNGFGYRPREIATPYLWSFSDRYVKGKYVRDGVFDPDAVSKQAGAAVVLKALVAAADIPRPADV